MNIGRLITDAVNRFPDRIAISFLDNKRTFSEFNKRVNRLANSLLQLGLQKGDRVADILQNSDNTLEVDFALAKAGLIRVAVNYRLTPEEILHNVNDSGALAVIAHEKFMNQVSFVKENSPRAKWFIGIGKSLDKSVFNHSYQDLMETGDEREPDIYIDENDIVSLNYTGGTTGRSKGAIRTHRMRLEGVRNALMAFNHETSPDDVFLHAGPMNHMSGLFALPHFVMGAKNVIMPKFDARVVLETIEKEKVTRTALVPTMIVRLLNETELNRYDLSSLKFVIYGGAPMPLGILQQAIGVMGNKFLQIYGMAECIPPVTVLRPGDHEGSVTEIMNSTGRPVLGVDLKVVDKSGSEAPVGEIGEIVTRGPHVMRGYWNDYIKTRDAIVNGWLYTGDLGFRDEKGFIHLVDRSKDMIISGGYNIYPKELEEVLYQHPAVLEAAVVGIPDPEWGEVVKAFVVLQEGMKASEDDLIQYVKKHLASYKKPKYVQFMKELPKSSLGKILKRELRKLGNSEGQ